MQRFWRYTISLLLTLLAFLPAQAVSAAEEGTAPHLYISAINPGYTDEILGGNTDDFVELYNPTGEPFPLSGYAIEYKDKIIYTFAPGAIMNGEYLLLRYKSSPTAAQSEDTYTTNISMTDGDITLLYNNNIVDQVCWGTSGCYSHFNLVATRRTTLHRCIIDGEVESCENPQDFIHSLDYATHYNPDAPSLILPLPDEEDPILPQCFGLQFSEIFTYYATDQTEQFIEFYNPTDEIIPLDGCHLSYKNKSYPLSGEVEEYGYYVYQDPSLQLTKNPTSSNIIYLLDTDGTRIDTLEYYKGQKKSVSLGYFGLDSNGEKIWLQTYAPTPGAANIYQEFRSCPTGKVINPDTGNCVNFSLSLILPDCGPGRFRNPATNRCKAIASTASALVPCAAGYERNPDTNRCRKIRVNNGTDYAVTPITFADKSSFMAYGALSAVITTGLLFIIFQFRHEITKPFRKLFSPKPNSPS